MADTNTIIADPTKSGPLATAAAAPGIDPNTGLPELKAPAPVDGQTIAKEKETFTDEWSKLPDGTPPVRTWREAGSRTGPNGEYLDAWYDTPVTPPSTVAPVPPPPAPTPAPAPTAPQQKYWGVWSQGVDAEGGAGIPRTYNVYEGAPGLNNRVVMSLREDQMPGGSRTDNPWGGGDFSNPGAWLNEEQMRTLGWNPPPAPAPAPAAPAPAPATPTPTPAPKPQP